MSSVSVNIVTSAINTEMASQYDLSSGICKKRAIYFENIKLSNRNKVAGSNGIN
jgi:hypothetical protein